MSTRRDFLAAALAVPSLPYLQPAPYDLILRGATVFDGTGAAGRALDVAVRGARIAALGARLRGRAREEIDVRGQALAEGRRGGSPR